MIERVGRWTGRAMMMWARTAVEVAGIVIMAAGLYELAGMGVALVFAGAGLLWEATMGGPGKGTR